MRGQNFYEFIIDFLQKKRQKRSKYFLESILGNISTRYGRCKHFLAFFPEVFSGEFLRNVNRSHNRIFPITI